MMRVKKMLLIVVWLLGSCIGFSAPAHAYLDPGTGTLLIQGLIASIAAGYATFSVYRQKIRAYFSKNNKLDDAHTDEQGKENE